jgi:hypothetical protein
VVVGLWTEAVLAYGFEPWTFPFFLGDRPKPDNVGFEMKVGRQEAESEFSLLERRRGVWKSDIVVIMR